VSLEAITAGNAADFLAYCRRHRYAHDESYLSDHDLEAFDPAGPEDLGLLYRDAEGRIRGAAALMLRPELRSAGKARFRIIHVEPELGPALVERVYRAFVDGLAERARDLEWLYLFLPEAAAGPAALFRELGFTIERYAWLLERGLSSLPSHELPEGLVFREAALRTVSGEPGPDAQAWCDLVNDAFEPIAGHVELLPRRLVADIDPNLDFKGSWLLLEEVATARAVGLCATIRDVEDEEGRTAFLGPVAILRAFQGRGLGRAALRAGLGAAKRAGFERCCLSVNAENANAARLYLEEGFEKKTVMVCWHRHP
jgi:mycothiol synthase